MCDTCTAVSGYHDEYEFIGATETDILSGLEMNGFAAAAVIAIAIETVAGSDFVNYKLDSIPFLKGKQHYKGGAKTAAAGLLLAMPNRYAKAAGLGFAYSGIKDLWTYWEQQYAKKDGVSGVAEGYSIADTEIEIVGDYDEDDEDLSELISGVEDGFEDDFEDGSRSGNHEEYSETVEEEREAHVMY